MTMQRLGKIATALLIGVTSGVLAYALGMPLPWMLGSMIGVTIAALAGAPIAAPDKLRPIVIPVIGVMLGPAITAELLDVIWNWAATLILLPPFLALAAGVSYLIYRRAGRYDTVTAFYASMPGGLNEMLVMGGEAGGDERRIALAHAARVLFVIIFVALYFGVVHGVTSNTSAAIWIALDALTLRDYVILGLCALIGVPLARAARLPAAQVFGPMILSAAAHITGIVTVPPPSVLIICAQLVIGTVIGCRFIGTTLRVVGRELGLAVASTLAMLSVAVLFSEGIALWIGMPLTQAFLAFAPGGLTEMSLLTLAIGQDIAFVSIVHIVRITLVIAIAPAVFRVFSARVPPPRQS